MLERVSDIKDFDQNLITTKFLDDSFEIYKLLAEKSIGDRFGSLAEIGDLAFTSVNPLFAHSYGGIFPHIDNELKKNFYEIEVLSGFDYHSKFILDEMYVCRIVSQNVCINVKLNNLFELVYKGNTQQVKIILLMLGYIDSSHKEYRTVSEFFHKLVCSYFQSFNGLSLDEIICLIAKNKNEDSYKLMIMDNFSKVKMF